MHSNSNRPGPRSAPPVHPLLSWAQCLSQASLEYSLFFSLNASVHTVSSSVAEHDAIQIKQVESEEENNSIVSDKGSFQCFTDQEEQDEERFTDEEVEERKPDKETEDSNWESLKQTAYFSSEGDREQEAEMAKIDMGKLSAKQRLLSKLLLEKSRIGNQTHNHSKENTSVQNASKDKAESHNRSVKEPRRAINVKVDEVIEGQQRQHKSIFTQTMKKTGAPPLNRTFKFR